MNDGAKPHTGKQKVDKLTYAGSRGGSSIQCVTQPAQSLDLNKDLCFFHNLKRKAYALISDAKCITDMISSVKVAFSQYDMDKFTVYRQMLEIKVLISMICLMRALARDSVSVTMCVI